MHYSRSAASRAGNVHSSKIKSLSFVELEALWRDNTECYSAAGAGLRQRLERVAIKKKSHTIHFFLMCFSMSLMGGLLAGPAALTLTLIAAVRDCDR